MEPVNRRIILASKSPYRRELMERLGLVFQTKSPDYDEASVGGETPRERAIRHGLGKACAVGALHPDALVIGSDQVAECESVALGKPGSPERAVEQLMTLSGKTALFHTSLALTCEGRETVGVELFRVNFRKFTLDEARRYVALDDPVDCAGSFKVERGGTTLMSSMEGRDFTSLIGLPLILLRELLADYRVNLP